MESIDGKKFDGDYYSSMGEMKLTFLGSGTSVGIPAIGCGCPVCLSDDPRDRRSRCSVWMRAPDKTWIIDTGPDLREQCLRAGITTLDAVLISHAHNDHIMGFDDLRRFAYARGGSLPVYAREHTMDALSRIFHYAFDPTKITPGYLHAEPHIIHEPFQLGKTRVTPVPVLHGNVPTIGFRFDYPGGPALFYASDVKEIPAESMALLHGLDAIIIDGLRFREHPTHMNVAEATAVSEALGSPPTWLTHLACDVAHARDSQRLAPHVQFAYDSLELTFPCTDF